MLARRSTLIFVVNVVGGILGYVGYFVVARFMASPEQALGLVGFGIGYGGSFFILTGLGIPTAHVKRISQGEPLNECLGTFVFLQLVQMALAVTAALGAFYLWTEVLGRGFETPEHAQVIFLMLVYWVAIATASIGFHTFAARLETARSQVSSVANTVVRVTGMIVVALAGLGALALAWVFVLGALAAAGASLLMLRGYPIGRPSLARARDYVRFAFPLAIPALLAALAVHADKALVQLFWGAAEVGYYFTVKRIIAVVTVISWGVSMLLFPALSQFHAENDLPQLRRKAREAERYLSMALVPVAAFLLLYAEGAIHVLLSDNFLPGADVLRIFAFQTVVAGLLVPRKAILAGMDRPDLSGTSSLVGMLLILGLYPVLIPTSLLGVPLAGLGGEGAALALLVGFTAILLLALAFSHRLVGDRMSPRLLLHVAAAAAVALVFLLIAPIEDQLLWRWFHLLGYSLAFLGAYLGVLAALGEFRREDLHLLLDVLNPRKMVGYIEGELRGGEEGPWEGPKKDGP